MATPAKKVDPSPSPSEANVNVDFEVKFKGEKDSTPSLNFDEATRKFQLKDGPLVIGTLEDFGSSVASFFGGHFPETDNIPVIGAIMNKLNFSIDTLDYTEAQNGMTSSFDLEIDIAPGQENDSSLKIGKAQVTDIDIKVTKQAQKAS